VGCLKTHLSLKISANIRQVVDVAAMESLETLDLDFNPSLPTEIVSESCFCRQTSGVALCMSFAHLLTPCSSFLFVFKCSSFLLLAFCKLDACKSMTTCFLGQNMCRSAGTLCGAFRAWSRPSESWTLRRSSQKPWHKPL